MPLPANLKKFIKHTLRIGQKEVTPDRAYDLWAPTYDDQTDNLIVQLDAAVFYQLLEKTSLEGRTVVDIGCGTGRHWPLLKDKKASRLIGYEVSAEMLNKLHGKYPDATAYLAKDNTLKELADDSCDAIISTLVIGYIDNLSAAFSEWDRVLKNGGDIIITDFHPAAVAGGATRSFNHKGQPVLIKNYLHPLEKIRELALHWQWKKVQLIQRSVDEEVRSFFEERNMLSHYENTYGTPVLYGWHFKKQTT